MLNIQEVAILKDKEFEGCAPGLKEFIANLDYSDLRVIPGEGLCGLQKFAFTWAIVTGLDFHCYARRYCFEHKQDALEALVQWTGHCHPSGPWIKCKGAGIDLLNPALNN